MRKTSSLLALLLLATVVLLTSCGTTKVPDNPSSENIPNLKSEEPTANAQEIVMTEDDLFAQSAKNNNGMFCAIGDYVYGPSYYVGKTGSSEEDYDTFYNYSWTNNPSSVFNPFKMNSLFNMSFRTIYHTFSSYNNTVFFSSGEGGVDASFGNRCFSLYDVWNIYSISQNEATPSLIIPGVCGDFQVVGDYIYYTKCGNSTATSAYVEHEGSIWQNKNYDSGTSHLYRTNLTTNGDTVEITSFPTYNFYIFNNKILYCKDSGNGNVLCMCDLDGSNEQQLSNKNFIHSPVYNGEYVYYLLSENNEENDWEKGQLWRMTLDGTVDEQISSSVVCDYCVSDYKIYYTTENDCTYTMNLDGSSVGVFFNSSCYGMQILQAEKNYLAYFLGCGVASDFYLNNMDGTQEIPFFNDEDIF